MNTQSEKYLKNYTNIKIICLKQKEKVYNIKIEGAQKHIK